MKENETPTGPGISRRGFLKGAGLSVAAGTLMGAAGDASLGEPRARETEVLEAGKRHKVTMLLNNQKVEVEVSTGDTLLETLRTQLDLTGAKPACEMGSCGACTVIVDGSPVNACLTLALDVDGAEVETVEGLARDGRLHPVQEAFVAEDALQCGFCTPGMVMSCKALVDRNPTPGRDEVQEAISGNLCRCGTYANVFRAMARVGSKKREGR